MMDNVVFINSVVIDWYDGPTLALAQEQSSSKWYLASIVYLHTSSIDRVFQVIEVQEFWALRLKQDLENLPYPSIIKRIKMKFKTYKRRLFLMKGQGFDDRQLEIVQIPLEMIEFHSSIGNIVDEDKSTKWLSFFDSPTRDLA